MGDGIRVLTEEELAKMIGEHRYQNYENDQHLDDMGLLLNDEARLQRRKLLKEAAETVLVSTAVVAKVEELRLASMALMSDTVAWAELKTAITKQQDHYVATLEALEMLKQANLELMEEKRLREERDQDDESSQ